MGRGKIWTGPLDYWTIFWTNFKPYFAPFYWGNVDYWYLGRGGRLTFVTEGGVEDEQSVGRKWREVVILINATDYWSFNGSFKLF